MRKMKKRPTLLLPKEYLKQATSYVRKAKKAISLVALVVANDAETDEFLRALGSAAERGVKVEVAADTLTFGELSGHLKPLKYHTMEAKETRKMIGILRKQGVRFTWVGNFSSLAFTGRNHMKCLVVDDTIFSFGGVNIDDESLQNIDYMFRLKDERLALELREDIGRIVAADRHNFAYRSHEFRYDTRTKILVDGGFMGDSIIYRRACQIAEHAKEITVVTQYCPTNKFSRLLKKTSSKLYFNLPQNTSSAVNRVFIRFNMFTSGHASLYKGSTYIHAKFIIALLEDGSKIALTGSHNFTYAGVLAGTREIALETTDPKIISQLENFLDTNVKN